MAGQKILIKKVLLVWGEIARELPGVSPACGVCCAPFRYAFYYYLSVAPLRISTLDQMDTSEDMLQLLSNKVLSINLHSKGLGFTLLLNYVVKTGSSFNFTINHRHSYCRASKSLDPIIIIIIIKFQDQSI